MSSYFTLLVRDDASSPWCIHFGDYVLQVVREERRDLIDAETYTARNTRIITTADSQASIDAAVAQANA